MTGPNWRNNIFLLHVTDDFPSFLSSIGPELVPFADLCHLYHNYYDNCVHKRAKRRLEAWKARKHYFLPTTQNISSHLASFSVLL